MSVYEIYVYIIYIFTFTLISLSLFIALYFQTTVPYFDLVCCLQCVPQHAVDFIFYLIIILLNYLWAYYYYTLEHNKIRS